LIVWQKIKLHLGRYRKTASSDSDPTIAPKTIPVQTPIVSIHVPNGSKSGIWQVSSTRRPKKAKIAGNDDERRIQFLIFKIL